MGALFGLVLVGFAVWIYGRTRLAAPLGRRLGIGLAAAGTRRRNPSRRVFADDRRGQCRRTPPRKAGLPTSPSPRSGLSALEAAGKPVFVNLTASWCVTCLINERVALDSEAVRQAFAARGIVALKGDWTTPKPGNHRLCLQQFGRSGVPLYLLYGGKRRTRYPAADPYRGERARRARQSLTRMEEDLWACSLRPSP